MSGVPINRKQVNAAGTGAKPWIILNRWADDDYSLNLIVDGTATFDVEGTLKQINRTDGAPESGTPAAEDIFILPSLTGKTASEFATVSDTPLEAIRINQTAGTGSVTLHVQQRP